MSILDWKTYLESLGNNPISDMDSYIDDMSLSMSDKISFVVDNINFDVIVDFGCADGTFLSSIKKANPNIKLIGYDIDQSMLSRSESLLGKESLLTNDWNKVVSEVQGYKYPLLNLSSVIHEVYSYSNSNTIKKFWNNQVFGGDFKYISIRDMIPSVNIGKDDINEFKEETKKVRRLANKYYLKSFEDRWGTISDNYRTFIHFILKYKYIENWDREVNENYLPVSLETVKSKIPKSYGIVYQDSFVLPFLEKQVKKDFGIDIKHSTHTKMILKNLKYK